VMTEVMKKVMPLNQDLLCPMQEKNYQLNLRLLLLNFYDGYVPSKPPSSIGFPVEVEEAETEAEEEPPPTNVITTLRAPWTPEDDEEESVQMSCNSTNMGESHNEENAFFNIHSTLTTHGSELICSHLWCSELGVKFLYCSVCALPVERQDFEAKHLHNLPLTEILEPQKKVILCQATSPLHARYPSEEEKLDVSPASSSSSSTPEIVLASENIDLQFPNNSIIFHRKEVAKDILHKTLISFVTKNLGYE